MISSLVDIRERRAWAIRSGTTRPARSPPRSRRWPRNCGGSYRACDFIPVRPDDSCSTTMPNIFGPVKDYPSMLTKISFFVFFASIAAIAILESQIPALAAILGSFSLAVPISGVPVPMGTIILAFLFTLFSRVIKLHDRLSDLLHIRSRFDVNEVLLPLAEGSGAKSDIETVRHHRSKLMQSVFYKYMNGDSAIQRHHVTMAFDQWSWYWILLELNFISVIVAVVLLIGGRLLPTALAIALILLVAYALYGVRASCARYAQREIDQILDDRARKREVAKVFDALHGRGA